MKIYKTNFRIMLKAFKLKKFDKFILYSNPIIYIGFLKQV